jgi:hypothetical protein
MVEGTGDRPPRPGYRRLDVGATGDGRSTTGSEACRPLPFRARNEVFKTLKTPSPAEERRLGNPGHSGSIFVSQTEADASGDLFRCRLRKFRRPGHRVPLSVCLDGLGHWGDDGGGGQIAGVKPATSSARAASLDASIGASLCAAPAPSIVEAPVARRAWLCG